jgi:hypothetical protein
MEAWMVKDTTKTNVDLCLLLKQPLVIVGFESIRNQ